MNTPPHTLWPALLLLSSLTAVAADSVALWPAVTLAEPGQVELGGPTGAALRRGVARLALPPYTSDWLLADVSFKVNRIFTNYSGDVSGRFIELAALTRPPTEWSPATLKPVLDNVAQFQKADGHFGLDLDLAQPMKKLSPPIPMLWGNARLLVGLVTAAREFQRSDLLAAARRLGDFYVTSTNVFCSPLRETELRATGTGGDGYTCCYFPAIEGLAMLYRATGDGRYLQQARRMAEWFKKFDALPTDHSHGNLCAWRGILELYAITGDRAYLDRALAKWQTAMHGGYVWPLGGVGEHWYVFHSGDEGCSESDWLRFNLDLWRFTGETRFLDTAERLLLNQYPANQCANGGYGWRHFDGDAAGPVGTRGPVDEWNFCCSFHGPLGLHYLKAYLAAGSERGVFINFPFDFSAGVKAGAGQWKVAVRTQAGAGQNQRECEVELHPANRAKSARTTLWLRKPDWATAVKVTTASGAVLPLSIEPGYVRLEREFTIGEKLRVTFETGLRAERRRFQPIALEPGRITRLRDVAVLAGPEILFATPAPASGRLALLATVDSAGKLGWPALSNSASATVVLPDLDIAIEQIGVLLESAPVAGLHPEAELRTRRRSAFMHDLLVVPANLLPASALAKFAVRAQQTEAAFVGPFYGQNLEQHPEMWLAANGWRFESNALHVTGGDVGLLDGEGYGDYRFEFDLELPKEGQGIAGWVVRATGAGDCLHFQVQAADSPYVAPQFKTRPNTLRPHVRRGGEWTIADPVSLPKPVRRSETHRIATECRGSEVTVFLDGQKVFTQPDGGFRVGTVGFRAASPAEQGLFRNITLQKL